MELFKGIAKDKTNADIGWMNSKASAYEYGYLRAAQILSINYENHHTIDKDSLIFPIIFYIDNTSNFHLNQLSEAFTLNYRLRNTISF